MYIIYQPEDYTAVAFLTTSVLSYVQESVSGFYSLEKPGWIIWAIDSLWAAEQFIPFFDVPGLYFQI